jgi:hypothetical protein
MQGKCIVGKGSKRGVIRGEWIYAQIGRRVSDCQAQRSIDSLASLSPLAFAVQRFTYKNVHCSVPKPYHAFFPFPQRRGHSRPKHSASCSRLGRGRYVHFCQLSTLSRRNALPCEGHEMVATIAQSHLNPKVLDAVCSILASDGDSGVRGDAPCYLASVATWADKERNHMRWSAPLHYVGSTGDHPPDNCLFPGTDGWEGKPLGNVLDAIHNVTSILSDFVSGSGANAVAPGQAQEALKFLIHFMGDMHQPLHLTGRDRGANGVKVVFGRRHTST